MTSGGNDFSDFPKNQLHSRQKNKLHLTKSGGGGSKARRALDFEKWGGSSLGALQKFTPMITRVTDGRTDRILITRLRLHFMQRGKNAKITGAKIIKLAEAPKLRVLQ